MPIALLSHTVPKEAMSCHAFSSPAIVYPWMAYTMRDSLKSDLFKLAFDTSQGSQGVKFSPVTPQALVLLQSWMRDMFKGFAFLKDSDILHRNIKPETFLMNENHLLRIGGFRYAINMRSRSEYERKRLSSQVYNINYRAPEVLAGQGDYSYPADIWAIGVTLLEMVLGTHPYAVFETLYLQGASVSSSSSSSSSASSHSLEALMVEKLLSFNGPWNPRNMPVVLQYAYIRVGNYDILQLIYYCLLRDPLQRITPRNALRLRILK